MIERVGDAARARRRLCSWHLRVWRVAVRGFSKTQSACIVGAAYPHVRGIVGATSCGEGEYRGSNNFLCGSHLTVSWEHPHVTGIWRSWGDGTWWYRYGPKYRI